MGFRRMADDERVTCAFHSVTVISALGFSIADDVLTDVVAEAPLPKLAGHPDGVVRYRIIVASSLARAVESALQDDFAGADEWQEERKASPPFVIIHIGPTEPVTSEKAYIKDAGAEGNIATYEAFLDVRQRLRRQRETAIAASIMALSASFATFHREVTFRVVDTIVAGRQTSGKWVTDIQVITSAQGRAISPVDGGRLTAFLSDAARLSASMPDSERRFFAMGLQDDDPLKRFLFLFLAIERHVNRAFKNIGPRSFATFGGIDPRVQQALRDFLANEAARKPLSLKSKFFFCTACSGPSSMTTMLLTSAI